MFKKVLQCFLAVSLSGLLLSGCAKSGTDKDTSSSAKAEQAEQEKKQLAKRMLHFLYGRVKKTKNISLQLHKTL